MLNSVLSYNSAGWATFPAKAQDKTPLVADWPDRQPDVLRVAAEEALYLQGGAFGVVLRPQDLIIDVDPRNFVDGVNPWKKLRQDHNIPNIPAPVVRTGGGGIHIYFRKPLDFVPVFKVKGYPGMEIKAGGKGAYVIGAGSGHESGERYILLDKVALGDVPDAPPELLEALRKPKTQKLKGTGLTGGEQELRRYCHHLTTEIANMATRGGDAQRFRVACIGRDYGLTPENTLKALAEHYNPYCEPVWDEAKLEQCVRNAYTYATGTAGKEDPALVFPEVVDGETWDEESDETRKWDLDAQQNPRKTLRNAINFLYIRPELKDTIRLNQFTGDIEMTGQVPWYNKRSPGAQWTDTDIILLKYHFAKECKIEFSVALLWEAVHAAAIRKGYHPVREHIESIIWDGTPRLDKWLTIYCGAPDNAYTSAVGRKTIAAMLARVFRPGVKYDHCLILEGAQGIGKSTVCAILGGKWYGDIVLDPHARDTVDAMRGKWVIELSEMEVTRRAEAQALKAFISRTTDRARLAYARTTLDFPRQCVFIGTINPDELGYLSDTTGNRRFWPVKCGDKINMDGLAKDRDQILAEAYVAYKKGETLYLDGGLAKLAEIEQHERMNVDPWYDVVAAWLTTAPEFTTVSVIQVWELAFGGQARQITRSDQCRIGRIMKDLGYMRHRPMVGGSRAYVYTRDHKLAAERMHEMGIDEEAPF